jgi:hypothetical protein
MSATAIERRVGNWTAFCVLEKNGAVVFRGENAYALPTRAAAERHAIVIGKHCEWRPSRFALKSRRPHNLALKRDVH